MRLKTGFLMTLVMFGVVSSLAAQALTTPPPADQVSDKAYSSVALVMASRTPTEPGGLAAGLVVRQNGVLLTAYHLIRNATSIQVRFRNGEIYDQVQVLGVDARRDVAAIRISAAALPVPSIAVAAQSKTGDAVSVLSQPEGSPWSVTSGTAGAYLLSDEVPGMGAGFRVLEFKSPAMRASSGGVLFDARGNALGLIAVPTAGGQNSNWAVPIDSVLGLADSPVTRVLSSSATSAPVAPVRVTFPTAPANLTESVAVPSAPEKSDALSASKDKDFILRNFKTMYVKAVDAKYFGSEQLKAQLGRNPDFAKLNISIVDDPRIADTVLEVGYTFAWDYPFQLKHQNTTIVLLSGKGLGPFSGIAGAADVAEQFSRLARPYRSEPKK